MDIVEAMTRIADASQREDGSDIPLGEQCREAADLIASLRSERDKLLEALKEAQRALLAVRPLAVLPESIDATLASIDAAIAAATGET